MTESALDAEWVRRRCRAALAVLEDCGVPREDNLAVARVALFVHVLRVVDTPDLRALREHWLTEPRLTAEEWAEAGPTSVGRFLVLGASAGAPSIIAVLWNEACEAVGDDYALDLLWHGLDAAAARRMIDGGP